MYYKYFIALGNQTKFSKFIVGPCIYLDFSYHYYIYLIILKDGTSQRNSILMFILFRIKYNFNSLLKRDSIVSVNIIHFILIIKNSNGIALDKM